MRWGLRGIRAGLMASVCLGAVTAHATDGTWSLVPADNNWNNAANWSSNPVVPNGTAIFNTDSAQMSITFSTPSTFIETIRFSSTTTPYSFSLPANSLTVSGKGIDLQLSAPAPTFTQSSIGSLIFTGSASASTKGQFGSANIINTDSAFTIFRNQSTAGFAKIQNSNNPFLGGGTRFEDQSTAGSAKISNTNLGTTAFYDSSNAGSATITNDNFGATVFQGQSGAGFCNATGCQTTTILNSHSGATFFNEQSSTAAGIGTLTTASGITATIVNETGGFTIFTDHSSATFAQITNRSNGGPGGVTEFRGNSTASLSIILNIEGGVTNFTGQSSAGIASITNGQAIAGGTLNFRDGSNAGGASISNNNGGTTNFYDMSTAAGLLAGNSAPSGATITNNNGGQTNFYDTSCAGILLSASCTAAIPINGGRTTIINNSGGQTNFYNQSSAGDATIINNNGGITHFHDQSTGFKVNITDNAGGQTIFDNGTNMDAPAIIVDNAVLTNNAGGSAFFRDQSTAGLGRLINNAGGVVDISGLTNPGMTAGSIEGAGTYFLGSKTLTVGLNNFSTEVSGVIADGGISGGKGGALVKVGDGTLILSGTNTYTGATTLNTGALIVNGSIAASSGLDVNAGTLLGGTGTLSTTRINAGGTLSPGNSIGAIAVAGNLSFAPGSFYAVEVSPTSSDRTVVNGTASVAGTVQSSFRPGSFQKSYTILSAAGGVSGTFDTLVSTGLPSFVTASLGYTPNLVTLNLTLGLALLPGLNGNAANVAAAIDSGFNAGNAIPAGFTALLALPPPSLSAPLTQLAGEAATGAQQSAFRLSDQFLGLMLDPFVDGRGSIGGTDRPALGFAPEREALPDDIALAYAKVLKAPPMKAPTFEQRWTAWGGAFGGGSRISGDPAVVGSHDLSATTMGFAGGLDYHLSRDSVVGVALAGGGTNWGLAQGLGGGKSDAFQAGLYGATRSGPAYVAAAFDFTNHWMSTDRFAFAGDHLTASFNAQSFGGRVEGGYRFGVSIGGITPYAAVQVQSFRTPSYSEVDTNGGGFALSYNSRTATDTRSELGARFDRALALYPNAVLALRARLAWAHDWVSDPALAAVFQTLPGASFIVNGATPAKDSALTSVGAEYRLANGVTLLAKFDGDFASHASAYGGTGTLRYLW
jgi:autotransporter-associated beta strand protein